ncbi:MAG: threonine aldolase, partial [Candidatus Thermoplasmatota archaeon]|nr:threonine aldolase [Candidatus Thermoplasmatota archaeon]
GARIGSALASFENDLSFNDIAQLTDVFYIGGTKNGALLGEAIVIVNPKLQGEFRRMLKQRGALLAKGRVIGAQFLELFRNDLLIELAKHANEMASQLTQGIKETGYKFLTDSPTNQIFPIFPNAVIDKLKELYGFYVWEKVSDDASAIRLVTSWNTKEENVNKFLEDLERLK